MRHFLMPGAVPRLACGVTEPAAPRVLVPASGLPHRTSARLGRAAWRAVPVTAIAAAAEEELLSAGRLRHRRTALVSA
jgi:hypothetical protein